MNEKELRALAAQLAKDLKTEANLNVFSRMLAKLTAETALNAELTDHVRHQKNAPKAGSKTRNDYSPNTWRCGDGKSKTPHDHDNTVKPKLISKVTYTVKEQVTKWQKPPSGYALSHRLP